MAKYNVKEVAKWFLIKDSMTQKRLQKLLYYTQAWSYALRDDAFMEASFEAWVHGPVSPQLRDVFGYTRLNVIDIKDENNLFYGYYFDKFKNVNNITDVDDVEFLESVWATYGDLSANALEVLTHKEAPWINARKGRAPNEICNREIDPKDMKEYYRSIYIGDE